MIEVQNKVNPAEFDPSHHTDLWIARYVMEWPVVAEGAAKPLEPGGVIVGNRPEIFRYGVIPDAFMPSTKIDDAVFVLRRMVDLGWIYMIHGTPVDKNIMVVFSKGEEESYAVANTESLAICRAAGMAILGGRDDNPIVA